MTRAYDDFKVFIVAAQIKVETIRLVLKFVRLFTNMILNLNKK